MTSEALSSSNDWDSIGIPDVFVTGDRKAIIEDALLKAAEAYGDPICGTTRATFALPCGTKVLKVPFTLSGISQNRTEANHKDGVPLADCRIVSEDGDVPILEMERVTPAERFSGRMPDWVYGVDSEQVGYTADGRLVAYDL